MPAAIIGILAVIFLLVGIAFALRPEPSPQTSQTEPVFAFVAFYFLLLGLRFMVGSINDSMILLGDFLASLALTFFWARQRK